MMGEWTTGQPVEWMDVRLWPWPWIRASVGSVDGVTWAAFLVDDHVDRADLGLYESKAEAKTGVEQALRLMSGRETLILGEDDFGRQWGLHLDVQAGHSLHDPSAAGAEVVQ